MSSALYTGTVRHRRFRERANAFTYKVAYAYVDLEALPPGHLVAFRPADYRTSDEIRAFAGYTSPSAPVHMLTTPRVLGLCFNPVTFYYCAGAVVADVTNTPWGERHMYLAGEDLPKQLHVSPLMAMDQTYSFRAPPPGRTLSVHIESTQDGERAFDATLNLRRRPFRRAPLLLTLRTLPLIYAHALALRLKGVPGHPRPKAIA
jgi:DUF1365 family protein